jgi:uroporphyrin-III C-methyltransferase/precorrin-2 dehydrogenase/sirohydrochlorin ferrochelatase
MRYLPLFARLDGRSCLVVGGGAVAERRVRQLLDAGGRVTVVAPSLTRALGRLADAGKLDHRREAFARQSLDEHWLVVAATGERALNASVARAASEARRFCNVVDDPVLCSFVMPAVIDRDPVTIAIGSAGAAPVLTRWIKGVIETALPLRLGALAALMGRWRSAVREAISASDRRRRFWERIVAGPVAEAAFAGKDDAAERALEKELASWRGPAAQGPGEAYLVGAGPGSADLITIRGRQLLGQADVVLYDRLADPSLLQFARRDAELISVGKSPAKPSMTQQQLNRLLTRLVGSGKRVCRLKGGDPLVFGRGGEELEALVSAGLPFQIVPGISALEGCAAYAGIPLTLRGVARTAVLATGQCRERGAADLPRFEPGQTLAVYMGVARYPQICERLAGLGYPADTPVAVVENGTRRSQRVVRTALASLAETAAAHSIRPPALLLVGETTRCAERYGWFAPDGLIMAEEAQRTTSSLACFG